MDLFCPAHGLHYLCRSEPEKQIIMSESMQDRYIRFDWAIKRLLRQKANFGVLEGFLTVFLDEPITIMEILESEGNQTAEDDKFNRVDIKARNSKGEIIIIEVQNTRELYYLERILYGVAKAITEHINLGDAYSEVKKVYSISILYFDLGVGSDYLYHGQNQFVGVHTKDLLQIRKKEQQAIVTRLPSEIFPEYILIRVNEFDKVAVTPLDEWVRYLKYGIISPDTRAPGLGEAREKLKYYSMTDKERRAYEEHLNAVMIQNDVLNTAKMEGRAEGHAEGLEEGLEKGRAEGLEEGHAKGLEEGLEKGHAEGRHEERIRNAANLKKLGVSSDIIAEATGLSLEKIAEI